MEVKFDFPLVYVANTCLGEQVTVDSSGSVYGVRTADGKTMVRKSELLCKYVSFNGIITDDTFVFYKRVGRKHKSFPLKHGKRFGRGYTILCTDYAIKY